MAGIVKNDPKVVRDEILLENLVLVDGQPGCGKTLFTSVIAAMDRVEMLKYSPQLENLCALKHLGKITDDAAEAMLRIEMDLAIYETMMSRNTNFRPSDLSGAFRDVDFWTYVKRLLSKGDELIPGRIKMEKPILHFATHNLMAFSEPVFKSFDDKVKIIEVVRHPLYMIAQQAMNHENWSRINGTARQFHLYIRFKDHQLPYYTNGWEELFIKSNSVERAILEINILFRLTESFKQGLNSERKSQILTIPFEKFVLDPFPYMEKIEKLLETHITQKTKKVMKKHNVPRKKISDGIPLAAYKRRGWESPEKELNERQELEKRRQDAIKQGAGKEAMNVLDRLCEKYESKYLSR